MPRPETKLLKVWETFEDGVGFVRDMEGTNGYLYGDSFVGLVGELRLTPLANTTSISTTPVAAIQHFFSQKLTANTDSGTANAAVTITATVLTDTRENWTINEHVGKIVTLSTGVSMTVTSNTGGLGTSSLTGGGWTGGVDPADGLAWTLGPGVDDWFIYAVTRNKALQSQTHKISGRNDDYGTLLETYSEAIGTVVGKPVKYNGFWYYGQDTGSSGNNIVFATVNVPPTDDGFTAGTLTRRCSHLALLGHQLVQAVQGSGVSILKQAGDPGATADWGTVFPVGSSYEIILAVASTQGQTYLLTQDGLYSFNKSGRSSLVLGDLGSYRSERPVCSVLIPAWGGLVFPHPTGIIFYEPGGKPINIAPSGRYQGPAPAALTAIQGLSAGRWHGLDVAGDSIYGIYQPDVTAVTYLTMWGQLSRPNDPTSIQWHVINTGSLDTGLYDEFPGIGFIGNTFPTSATTPRPVICYSNLDDMRYMILDPQGKPLIPRGESLSTATSGSVIFSELIFPQEVRLKELIVFLEDMAVGDSVQLSAAFNNASSFVDLGAPIDNSGRSVRMISQGNPRISRALFKMTYSSTAANPKYPMGLKRMELYGTPA